MSRSNEIRRIEAALATGESKELEWALAQCEARKPFRRTPSPLWYRLEKEIRRRLAEAAEGEA